VKHAWAAIVCFAVAGCAGPRPQTPADASVTPPSSWRRASPDTGIPVTAAWWDAFGDPALTRTVAAALANNTDIQLAAARVGEARGEFHLASAQLLPDVSARAGGGRERSVNAGFGIPELQNGGQANVVLSYDVDLFGQLAKARDAAYARLLSSADARDSVRLAVAASTAGGYITLAALDARLVVLRETLAQRANSLNVIRRRAQAGYSTQLDLAQAEAEYRAAAQLIPAAELAIAHQENGLSVLLGSAPREVQRGRQLHGFVVPGIPAAVPSALLRRRPDIAAAEEQLVAADATLDSARAAFMPSVQLSANGGVVASTLIHPNPIWIWALAAAVSAPIFDSGRLQAQQETAAARRDQAAYAYKNAALTAFREVEDGLASVRILENQETELLGQRDALAHALELATRRFRAGYSPYLDQLDAERGLLSAELSLVQSRADRLSAAVDLYRALGGGWDRSYELR
jgi:NodT family efflux transporter outer membrane factor (OMF) lipoprotein